MLVLRSPDATTAVRRLLDAPADVFRRSLSRPGATRYTGCESDVVWLGPDDIEECDRPRNKPLPIDVVRAIRATADRLEELDPYSLIGVEADADWGDIEKAYRQRLATFHPSRWSEHDIDDLRPSMETITERISLAFATLADELAVESSAAERVERPTTPSLRSSDLDLELSGDRPTYPSSGRVAKASPVKKPAPPPRRKA
jgi:hypothetical protein